MNNGQTNEVKKIIDETEVDLSFCFQAIVILRDVPF